MESRAGRPHHDGWQAREGAKEDGFGAEWKIAIARALRRRIGATNSWIARELRMGAVSQYLSDVRVGRRRIMILGA